MEITASEFIQVCDAAITAVERRSEKPIHGGFIISQKALDEACRRLTQSGDLLGSIILYRNATNIGLKEAKQHCEQWRN